MKQRLLLSSFSIRRMDSTLRAASSNPFLAFEAAPLVCSPFGSAPGSPSRSLQRLRAGFFDLGAGLAFLAQLLELLVGEMLDTDERISRGADADQLIELDLDSSAVAIL